MIIKEFRKGPKKSYKFGFMEEYKCNLHGVPFSETALTNTHQKLVGIEDKILILASEKIEISEHG